MQIMEFVSNLGFAVPGKSELISKFLTRKEYLISLSLVVYFPEILCREINFFFLICLNLVIFPSKIDFK